MQFVAPVIHGIRRSEGRKQEKPLKDQYEFIPLAKPSMGEDEIAAVSDVIRSGMLTTGPKVFEFEKKFAEYIGDEVSAIALNSCTGGLFLALLALGIGPGDEVIVPSWTFAATAHVVCWTGAKPVFCDAEYDTCNIDLEDMEKKITKKTKAVIPVHYAGYPCEMDLLMDIARKNGLYVIEDAAHIVGGSFKEKKIGLWGDITVFSFYATKNLACGEGGMAVSKNQSLIEKINKLSYFGINKDAFNRYAEKGKWYYEIEEIGYKYNMDSLQAAIGLVQLEKLDMMNEKRRAIAATYRSSLDARIKCPFDDDRAYHVYHLFPVKIDPAIIGRDRFMDKLKDRRIGASMHFIPLHKHPYYKSYVTGTGLPVCDSLYKELISLPLYPDMTSDQLEYIIESINNIFEKEV
jgi:UDP-4-amino-4-deoxy-L-arabinose-oxoglutarate aminotransferase